MPMLHLPLSKAYPGRRAADAAHPLMLDDTYLTLMERGTHAPLHPESTFVLIYMDVETLKARHPPRPGYSTYKPISGHLARAIPLRVYSQSPACHVCTAAWCAANCARRARPVRRFTGPRLAAPYLIVYSFRMAVKMYSLATFGGLVCHDDAGADANLHAGQSWCTTTSSSPSATRWRGCGRGSSRGSLCFGSWCVIAHDLLQALCRAQTDWYR